MAHRTTVLKQEPFAGHMFVSRGRRGGLIKIIWWDGQGACQFSRRLAVGEGGQDRADASAAGCTPMAPPGSRTSTGPSTSTRSPAWRMSGASSSTSIGPGGCDRQRGHQADRRVLYRRGAGIAARPPCRAAPGESRADPQRFEELAARPTADDRGHVAAGHGEPRHSTASPPTRSPA